MNLNAASVIVAGCASALGLGFTTASLTIEVAPREPWLQIESLRIDGNTVFQKRRVLPDLLLAVYGVRVADAEGRTLCGGGGTWPYRPVTPPRELRIEFDEWVGEPGCYARLREGESYRAHAEWSWTGPDGALQTTARDLTFTR